MSTTKQAPEPWVFDEGDGWLITDSNGAPLASVMCSDDFPCIEDDDAERVNAEAEKTGKRIVECVNACEGIRDPAAELERVRTALRAMIKAHGELMKGVRHIAIQDYANLNMAPILALDALRALGGKP